MKETRKYILDNGILTIKDKIDLDFLIKDDLKEKDSIKEILLPNNIEEIGVFAFAGCHNLEKINIPDSVKKIDTSAFSFCLNLKEISFPNDLEIIGECAFYCCENLETVFISKSTKIGNNAFYQVSEKVKLIYYGQERKENNIHYLQRLNAGKYPSFFVFGQIQGKDIECRLVPLAQNKMTQINLNYIFQNQKKVELEIKPYLYKDKQGKQRKSIGYQISKQEPLFTKIVLLKPYTKSDRILLEYLLNKGEKK